MDTDINIDELAQKFNISKIHFHKIFKEQLGKNIYETIKSIKLQKASSLLLTNRSSTITQVANMCGYSSQTSFIRAFKQRFEQTPKEWRNGGFKKYSMNILNTSQIPFATHTVFANVEPKITKIKPFRAYYIRQKGYDIPLITRMWQKLQAWIFTNNIDNYDLVGVYHDNPTITPHDECYYIGAVAPKGKYNLAHTNLPHFTFAEALYAVFDIKGVHGDVLKFIEWIYHEWLPKSGFETTTSPAFTIFEENHYLNESKIFIASFYLPIQYT